jgi:hypothetical protein
MILAVVNARRFKLGAFAWLAVAQVLPLAYSLLARMMLNRWMEAAISTGQASQEQLMRDRYFWMDSGGATVEFVLMLIFVVWLIRDLQRLQAAAGTGYAQARRVV